MKQKILPPKILVISRRFDFNVLDEFMLVYSWGFHAGSDGTESVCKVGNPGSIPGQEDSLEKEMATHSSILARRISWTEEPGGLPSVGSQRVRHD